jgi:hypothetical protein
MAISLAGTSYLYGSGITQPVRRATSNPLGSNALGASTSQNTATAGGQNVDSMSVLKALLAQLKDVLAQMLSAKGIAPTANNTGNAVPNATGALGNNAAINNGPINTNQLANQVQGNGNSRQQLLNSLNTIAQDPEGRVLVQQALKNGVTFSAGNTGASNVLGEFTPGNNHIVVGNPNDIKTLVHEMVHAASKQDGNSQLEEGIANVIGDRVSARLAGRAASNNAQNILSTTARLYPELGASNNIRQTLFGLGITA